MRASRRSDNKGKNVSNRNDDDDDDADTEKDNDDDASFPLAASHTRATHSPSPPNACADSELVLSGRSSISHSSLDEAKIGEYISYIEQLDDLERHDPDRVDFKEHPDMSRRIRHTSYNTNATERDLEGIVVNKGDAILLDRVNSQEEQLKSIQAQIEKINSSLAPVTRDLLSVESAVISTNTFIQGESIVESTTTIFTEKPPQSVKIVESVQVNETSPMKYVTLENISLLGHSDESTPNLTPMTAASDSGITKTFELRPNILRMNSAGHPPIRQSLFMRAESIESGEPTNFSRQQSTSSGVSTILDREAELGYIRGRDDWRDLRRGSHISDAIDSDNYHHHRRYSEVDDTLEYIRGRDDWRQRQAERERTFDIIEVNDSSASVSVSIRDQIDSDEYHHARRLSECLDLAYTNRNVRFTAQEARNGRSRSPFRVLRSEMDRKEYLDRYYLKGSDQFERAVSENRDVAEERMITNERLSWSKSSTRTLSSLSPAPIHILIEDTSLEGTETGLETWEEMEVVDFPDDAPSTGNSRTSSGWDLEQSYDTDDIIAENTSTVMKPPDSDSMDEHRHRADTMVHQNTLVEDDNEADEEVAGILNVQRPNAMDSLKESSSEHTASDLSCEEDDKNGSTSLKKSKTTRNLLLAERLSVDLSANEEALKAIAAKSDEMKRTKSGAISSFLEQERQSEEQHVAAGKKLVAATSSTSKTTINTMKPVKITTMSDKCSLQKSIIQQRANVTRTQENMDDLMLETSMGPWFHK